MIRVRIITDLATVEMKTDAPYNPDVCEDLTNRIVVLTKEAMTNAVTTEFSEDDFEAAVIVNDPADPA